MSVSSAKLEHFPCIQTAATPCIIHLKGERSAFNIILAALHKLMTALHEYSVGDNVYYLVSPKWAYRAPGTYRIVRLRPSEGSDCQYWIRSALENFDRIAVESELGIIRPCSDARVTRQFVTFPAPFHLKAMEQEMPAGVYEITTTEEAIGDFMYEAYRRISTTIYFPPRSDDYGIGKFVETDPAELEKLTNGSERHD
jgi:hypothetical protein